MNKFLNYLKMQKFNGYISDSELDFLIKNKTIFINEINNLNKASFKADMMNDNKNFVRSILNITMQTLGVVAIC
ncbi:hypothetical protein [Herbiconiux daphne]|uniref:Uncharacterized protein n=1 Tax=Herbiconiux daphne TaxID=2970914 RepID=A0ABT2H966_9MICO|nr:hypothetical protein [Herbiconiux daphne]MCS5736510.1 hypothetical protein [Herbiconiux daphne]